MAISGIITLIICCYKKRKTLSQKSKKDENIYNSSTDLNFQSKQINNLTVNDIYEFEPEVQSFNPKVKIIFETTSQSKIKILIDPEKTVTEAIQFFFKIIKQEELFGDSTIRFLLNGNTIGHNSKDLIKNYINKKIDANTIVVADEDDKIKQF